jgi:hypothetical protein
MPLMALLAEGTSKRHDYKMMQAYASHDASDGAHNKASQKGEDHAFSVGANTIEEILAGSTERPFVSTPLPFSPPTGALDENNARVLANAKRRVFDYCLAKALIDNAVRSADDIAPELDTRRRA